MLFSPRKYNYAFSGNISIHPVDTGYYESLGGVFSNVSCRKMLTYALGRELTFGDRKVVKQILEELEHRGNGLQDLAELVVTSKAFQEI